jgi:hypothetical protein
MNMLDMMYMQKAHDIIIKKPASNGGKEEAIYSCPILSKTMLVVP